MILLPVRRALLAGIALVLVTNAVAIIGVVRNRASVETRFVLGVDELWMSPYRGSRTPDDVGSRDLTLHVRLPSEPGGLSDDQIRAIGLDPARLACSDISREHEVFVALELGGPAAAHQREVDEARRLARPADGPTLDHGRLFAVDFDRDATSLRARHPDAATVAIARGIVREARWCDSGQPALLRHVVFSGLSRPSVHVPYRLAGQASIDDTGHPQAWRVHLAFGGRHEAFVEAIDRP